MEIKKKYLRGKTLFSYFAYVLMKLSFFTTLFLLMYLFISNDLGSQGESIRVITVFEFGKAGFLSLILLFIDELRYTIGNLKK